MKYARSYQQNTLLKQEINALKKKQKCGWRNTKNNLLEQNFLSIRSTDLLQKAEQTKQQQARLKN